MHKILRYTQEMADINSLIWTNWMAGDYSRVSAMVDQNIDNWTAVKAIAERALDYTAGTITGTIDPDDEQEGVALDEFTITLDCCPINPETVETLSLDGIDSQNIEHIKAQYAEKLWDALTATDTAYKTANPDGCSPLINIEIVSTYSGHDLISFSFDSRGGVGAVSTQPEDPEADPVLIQTIHMVTKDLLAEIYGVTGGWIEDCAFNMSFGDGESKQAFKYPSGENYNLATIPAPAMGEIVELPIGMKVSGRLIEMPGTLGCSVTPSFENSEGLMDGGMVIEPGWNFASRMLWFEFQDWWYKQDTTPAQNPWYCRTLPRGYQIFLSKYYDHPIITRENVYPIITKTPAEEAEDLDFIYTYVNTTFNGEIDPYSHWHFMSEKTFTEGDCEDFALTYAQMLIEYGWDVTRLKLEGGWYSYLPGFGDDPVIQWSGHLWLTVDDSIALDVNGHDLAYLRAKYNEIQIIQTNEVFESEIVDGAKPCWWERTDDWATWYLNAQERMIKIEPFPSIDFDMSIWNLAGEIERTQ